MKLTAFVDLTNGYDPNHSLLAVARQRPELFADLYLITTESVLAVVQSEFPKLELRLATSLGREAIDAVEGDLVLTIDGHDKVSLDFVVEAIELAASNPQVALVFGQLKTNQVLSPKSLESLREPTLIAAEEVIPNFVQYDENTFLFTRSCFVRRDVLQKLGGYISDGRTVLISLSNAVIASELGAVYIPNVFIERSAPFQVAIEDIIAGTNANVRAMNSELLRSAFPLNFVANWSDSWIKNRIAEVIAATHPSNVASLKSAISGILSAIPGKNLVCPETISALTGDSQGASDAGDQTVVVETDLDLKSTTASRNAAGFSVMSSTSPTQVIVNGVAYQIRETIDSGTTSTVFPTTCGKVIKRFNTNPSNIFEREAFWLEKFRSKPFTPSLIAVDKENMLLVLEDMGEKLSSANLPSNWREQVRNILSELGAANCSHNDLSQEEVLVKDGMLSIIDFGWASLNGDYSCGAGLSADVKKRVFYDRDIENLISFYFEGSTPGSELHCFILWKTEDEQTVQMELEKQYTIIRTIRYYPHLFKSDNERTAFLDEFYRGTTCTHGDKAEKPFTVWVVRDEAPVYEPRENVGRGTVNFENIKNFDLKNRLRKGRKQYLHASSHLEEAHDNLKALTFYGAEIPLCFWNQWRPKFSGLREWFDLLNRTTDLEYVVLRNYDNFPDDYRLDEHADVDILVNSYHRLKALSGGKSYKHQIPQFDKKWGPCVEDGGYKVANYVNFGGVEVSVDIRHLGDNYYDEKWERDMLKNRVLHKGFFVLGEEDHFYSLLYHALAHKTKVSDTYKNKFVSYPIGQALGITEATVHDNNFLWDILDRFMNQRGYRYVRPNELNIPYNVRGVAEQAQSGSLA